MDTEREPKPTTAPAVDAAPAYDFRDLDHETLEILMDDKIATGG